MMFISLKSKSGFTLVELMVALFLTVIAVVAIYRSYVAIRIGMETQEQQAEIHQNLRIGVQRMVRDLRMATYDPEGNSEAGFTVADDTEIRFTQDLDDNGDVLGPGEDVSFIWESPNPGAPLPWPLVRADNIASTTATMINNVSGLRFIYLTDDNPPELLDSKPLSAFERKKIRNIEIILVARATNSDPGYRNFRTYLSTQDEDPPNVPLGPPDVVFTGPGDNFRRGSLVARVKARNAGLN